jgi:hypothetical protein
MDKREFIQSAPMYYALAIAHVVRSEPRDRYLHEGDIKAAYSFQHEDQETYGNFLENQDLFNRGISILAGYKMIEIVHDKFGPRLLRQTATFEDTFTALSKDEDSPFFKYMLVSYAGRGKWVEGALMSVQDWYVTLNILSQDLYNIDLAQKQKNIEAPDDKWEPIPLDRSDEKLQAAIEQLDDIVEQLRSDNGYAATHPQEKTYVLDKLRAVTKRLKEDSHISVVYLSDFAVKPLTIVIKRFAKAAIGVVAEGAKAALIEWLKSKGVDLLNWF